MTSTSIDNVHYISLYFTHMEDMKYWNHDNYQMNAATKILRSAFKNITACTQVFQGSIGNIDINRTLHLIFTDEALMIAENAIQDKWEYIIRFLLNIIRKFCPLARIHYKTTSSLRSQYGSLSWQRLWQETRLALHIADDLGIPAVDSFNITHPLIMETSIFPDSVHLYEKFLVGNFVSKTVSMLLLKQVCE